MHIGAVSVAFPHLSLAEVAAYYKKLGIKSIEPGVGGYFTKPHCDPAKLAADRGALEHFQETLADAGLKISALAIHGEPLNPDPKVSEAYAKDFREACEFAALADVDRFTLLAGLPEAAPGDKAANWIQFPTPPRNVKMLEWQWEERVIPYWKEQGKVAADHGVRLCFEMLPGDVVYNFETMKRLRDAVGPVIGNNLDPSHLFFMSIDVIELIHELGDMIYHVHAKDSALNQRNIRVNGTLDPKQFGRINERSWIYRAIGFGHDERFWRDFVSALRMIGYDDVLSIEHEDLLIDIEEGFEKAVRTLQGVIIDKPPPPDLWFS